MGEGYAIHGTHAGVIQPGKFSHGCVRMNNKDLLQLVHLVEVGTVVYLY
jgi:lipoprotein-anchoring transpeptidase ErfK/SrfK